MRDNAGKRVHNVYLRVVNAGVPSRVPSALFGVAAAFSIASLVALLLDWFPPQVQPIAQASLVVAPLVLLFLLGLLYSIGFAADLLFLKKAINSLRYGDWDRLCHAVIDRRIRSEAILRDPSVVLLVGNLFQRLGYEQEGESLVAHALQEAPELKAMQLCSSSALSPSDAQTLTEGLDGLSRRSTLLRAWRMRPLRYALVIAGALFLLLFYVMQWLSVHSMTP